MILGRDNVVIIIAIIVSLFWAFMEGFSVIVIGKFGGIPGYILKNPCWLIVIFLAFKGVCVWTKLLLNWKVDMGIRHLLGCFALYFTNPLLLVPFSVATYLYRCNGDQLHMGYVVCFLSLFVLNSVSRLMIFIRWHRPVECDKSPFVRLSQSSKPYKVAWAFLSVETLLMICLWIVNLHRGR